MSPISPAAYAAALLISLAGHSVRAQRPYDFENFPLGLMFSDAQPGNDGWRLYPGSGVAGSRQLFVVQAAGREGKVLQAQLNSYPAISRVNDARYAFPPFQGVETDATMMFDVRFTAVASGNHAAAMTLGHDGPDVDAVLSRNDESGPTFGIRCVYLGVSPPIPVSFYVRGAGFSANSVNIPVTAAHAVTGDWLRLALRMNLTQGTGTMLYKNITRGDTGFTAIAGLQNVGLDLGNLAPGNGPAQWDAIYLLLAEVGSAVAFQMDNVVPHVRAREPYILRTEFDPLAVGGPRMKAHFGVLPPGKVWSLQGRRLADDPSAWVEVSRFTGVDEYGTVEVPLSGEFEPLVYRLLEVP